MFARASGWYRAYHEIWRSGKFAEELQRLHKVYGPVVRIGPNDVHFSSPEAYEAIYNARSKVIKDPWLYKCFSEDESLFGYTDPVAAKVRRHQLAPFFSRQNILSLQDMITEKVDLLCEKLNHSIVEGTSGAVVDVGSAIKSMAMDAVMSVCLGESLNTLEDPKFRHPVIEFMEQSLPLLWVFKHIPIIRVMMLSIPDGVSARMGTHGILLLKKKLDAFLAGLEDLDATQNTRKHGFNTDFGSKEIIFHRLLDDNNKPVAHYGSLFDEAQALFVAGSDTVGNTLSLSIFHILSNEEVYSNLCKELKEAWPSGDLKNISTRPRWENFEKLPYLTAVIKEALRLSHGIVSPLSRIVPAQGLTVDGIFMPPATVISGSAPFVHLNERLFPDPRTFKPERWLSQESKGLEKYIVAFSRGPRSCIGINLAWCEMYLTLALLFRKFDLELFETSAKDIEYKDYFVPSFYGRIRATIKQRCD
ncbi:cytochrome P450 [Tirmania nivea]|nr:cytochrome P450 [Tirmania nivea]